MGSVVSASSSGIIGIQLCDYHRSETAIKDIFLCDHVFGSTEKPTSLEKPASSHAGRLQRADADSRSGVVIERHRIGHAENR